MISRMARGANRGLHKRVGVLGAALGKASGQFRCGVLGNQYTGVALVREPGAAAMLTTCLQGPIDLLYEVFQVQVQVVHHGPAWMRSNPTGIPATDGQVGARLDGTWIFLTVDRQVAVHDAGRRGSLTPSIADSAWKLTSCR